MKAIEVLSLDYAYHDGKTALKDISISVEKGDVVAVMGPNGAGKTTLLKHFNALLLPSAGRVLIQGTEVTKKSARDVRKRVGFLFQNPDDQVFSPTVLEDVMFGPVNMGYSQPEAEEMARNSLKSLGIEELSERHPAHLSYGQKKKVALAGVIVMEPEILVMDEPLAGLDYSGSRELKGIIRGLNREKDMTVVFSTHLTERAAELSNRSVILNSGSLLAEGDTRELLTDASLMKRAGLEPPAVTSIFLPFRPENPPLTREEGVAALEELAGNGRKNKDDSEGGE